VVFDLTVAVEAGLIAACITFIYRISSLSRSEPITAADQPVLAGHEGRIEVHRLYGALFFGAVKLIEVLEDHLPEQALVIDLKNVIYVDSSGADSLLNLERTCRKQGVRLIVCGLVHQPLDMARRCGFIDAIAPQNQCVDLAAGLAAALDPPAG